MLIQRVNNRSRESSHSPRQFPFTTASQSATKIVHNKATVNQEPLYFEDDRDIESDESEDAEERLDCVHDIHS